MNKQQAAFVREYLVDLCAKDAAIRAGYSPTSAKQHAYDLLQKPEIQAAIQAEMDRRAERTQITADYVLEGIRKTTERCAVEGEEFNPNAALKGYELMGKHLKLFTDKHEHSGHVTVERVQSDARDFTQRIASLADRVAETKH